MPGSAGGPKAQPPQAPSKPSKSAWNPREPLSVTVTYRGGPECWIELKARGETIRVPGHTALYDVMRRVWGTP